MIIGAGFLGLSAALTLAEKEPMLDIVVFERGNVGNGASGRNGGHLMNGFARWDAEQMIANVGEEKARRLWHGAATESFNIIDYAIERYNIPAERRYGHLTLYLHPNNLNIMKEYSEIVSEKFDYHSIKTIEKKDLHNYVGSNKYHGASIDMAGGHMNSLAYVRGIAEAAQSLGVKIYENTPVNKIDENGKFVEVNGVRVHAQRAIFLAVHSNTRALLARNVSI